MFHKFHGFHLIEELHKRNLERAAKRLNSKVVKILLAIAATLTIWLLPAESFGMANLTVVEQRIIGIFVFATVMWIMEAIPAWTTSLIAVVLLLFMVSTSALKPFVEGYEAEQLGTILKYEDILHCFADPIIMLFIGGFILAIAATKYGLDATIARVLLKPFGTQSRFVMLGFIMVTGLFSMFVSNTATAAMMLAFLAPVLKALPADGKGKIGLALSIPVAANIGGMATPIGTPPNGIVLKYLNDPAGMNMNIGFGDWTAFMFPLTIVLLFLSWIILLKMFPFKQKTINLEIPDNSKKSWRTTLVYI
ncbi:MAG: anion permease, partial [Bacteroidaceae bacterium]|nr:anion permease [Bacteroidaceae bacterium]